LSEIQKNELFDFIRCTRNKEEYKRALIIKQKMEGLSYRTIAKNLGVNYRNVYRIVDVYRKEEDGLDGIRSKRKNAGRIPNISSEKNK
jgi:transposase